VAQLYPQALGAHFVAFYDTHELRWGYSLLPATTRGKTEYLKDKINEFDTYNKNKNIKQTEA
jgi:hypothetical protein